MKKFLIHCSIFSLCGALSLQSVGAEQPLHHRIDELIATAAGEWPIATRSSDSEFLRRIYIDLAGRIPTAEEARKFLDNGSTHKRASLINDLLSSPDYTRNMSEQFHIMLMERLGNDVEWEMFLRNSFEANEPWDKMARDILSPKKEDELHRGAAFFLTARLISEGAMAETDVPGLTRDVARLLAGQDIQCAQCHDHISIHDYKQRDFQGLHAIFLNIKQDRSVKFPAVTEGLMAKKHEFMSVFIQEPEETGPRVPGIGEIDLVTFPKDEEYIIPPDPKKRTPGVPKFSPLGELAGRLTESHNHVFCQNIANRLWFLMMGRGLVHPLDEHHSDNIASHPQLLTLLAEQFAAHSFDIKWLLKEIALSETYQRTSILPKGQNPPPADKFVLAHQKRISPEQLVSCTLVATGKLQQRFALQNSGETDSAAVNEQLSKLRKEFVKMFSNPPRNPEVEFEPSVQGTLFALNNEQALELFKRRDGNLIDRLMSLPDDQVADELFLSLLTRHPSEADRADVNEAIANAIDREKILGYLAWALWSSNEFFINH